MKILILGLIILGGCKGKDPRMSNLGGMSHGNWGTLKVQSRVTGLESTESVTLESSKRVTYKLTGSTNSFSETIPMNERYLMEIRTSSPTKYCFFDSNGSYQVSNRDNHSNNFNITCVPRQTNSCQLASGELPVVDGSVYKADCYKDKLVYAGQFTSTGRYYGILNLDLTKERPLPSPGVFDRLSQPVSKIISDGKDGWFIGFQQTTWSEPYGAIIHLNKDFMIDESFNFHSKGQVHDMELYLDNTTGESTLFASGRFDNYGHFDTIIKLNYNQPHQVQADFLDIYNPIILNSMRSKIKVINDVLYISDSQRVITKSLKVYSPPSISNIGGYIENGHTVFWKDLAGTVWLLNPSVAGMINTRDLTTKLTTELPVVLGRKYSLSGNTLYISSGISDTSLSQLKKVNLAAETFLLENFGQLSNGDPALISGALSIHSSDTNVCVLQHEATFKLLADHLGNDRFGVACFEKSTGILSAFAPFASKEKVTTLHFNGQSLIIGSLFFDSVKSNNLSIVDAKTNLTIPFVSGLDINSHIQSLDHSKDIDSNYIYFAGGFSNIGGNNLLRYVSRVDISTPTPTIDSNWYITDWSLASGIFGVYKIAVANDYTMVRTDNNYLVILDNGSSNTMVSKQVINDFWDFIAIENRFIGLSYYYDPVTNIHSNQIVELDFSQTTWTSSPIQTEVDYLSRTNDYIVSKSRATGRGLLLDAITGTTPQEFSILPSPDTILGVGDKVCFRQGPILSCIDSNYPSQEPSIQQTGTFQINSLTPHSIGNYILFTGGYYSKNFTIIPRTGSN